MSGTPTFKPQQQTIHDPREPENTKKVCGQNGRPMADQSWHQFQTFQ